MEYVLSIIKVAQSGTIQNKPWPKERESIEIGNFVVTHDKITKMLGWSPTTPFEDGVKKTIDYYNAHRTKYF